MYVQQDVHSHHVNRGDCNGRIDGLPQDDRRQRQRSRIHGQSTNRRRDDDGGSTTGISSTRQSKQSTRSLATRYPRKPGSNAPWVMAVSRIVNDTTLNLDTDQLVKKIRIALLNSGRVIVTTAVGADGPEDKLSAEVRKLRNSKLFNQETVAKDGTMVAPELSLSGKIIQRANTVGKKQQVDYYFQLTMTNIDTGLAYWEFEQIIAKLGTNQTFSWN